ncbi:MAG: hypothetical protein BWY80_01180 [Firmicutes bacterium ADurb.Bin456]|nr:MAG: hypothetical protein BWY80_01180 [Firmicutes bacterium ADurb.Bin456]
MQVPQHFREGKSIGGQFFLVQLDLNFPFPCAVQVYGAHTVYGFQAALDGIVHDFGQLTHGQIPGHRQGKNRHGHGIKFGDNRLLTVLGQLTPDGPDLVPDALGSHIGIGFQGKLPEGYTDAFPGTGMNMLHPGYLPEGLLQFLADF